MNLKEYLKKERRTQVWLADQMHLTRATIYNYCHKKRTPSYHVCKMIEAVTKGEVGPKDFGYEEKSNGPKT